MKKLLIAVVAGLLAGVALAQGPTLVQEQKDLDVSGEIGLYSHYVWRGQIYDDSVVQPSLTVAKGPFSLNVWGNYNLESRDSDDRPNNDLTETDFTLSFRVPDNTDDFDIDIGIIKYIFTDAADLTGDSIDTDTEELFITAVFHNIILTPVVSIYHDMDASKGWYGSLALSQAVEISEALEVEAGLSVGLADGGYNSGNYSGSSGGGFNDYNASLSATYQVTDDVAVGALLQYTMLDGKIEKGAKEDNGSDNAVWGGFSVSYTF